MTSRSPRAPAEEEQRQQVRSERGRGDDHDEWGVDVLGLEDATDAFPDHERRHAEQEHGVQGGGQDLDPVQAVAADLAGRRPVGEPDRAEGERDPRDVGEDVRRVREQGQ